MAEIHLQPRGRKVLARTLAAVAVVLLTWVLAQTSAVDEGPANQNVAAMRPEPEIVATSGITPSVPAEVAAFLTFAEMSGGPAALPAEDYAAAGIARLRPALETIARDTARESDTVNQHLQTFGQRAQRIPSNASAGSHSDEVRAAFVSAVRLMAAMQQDRWPEAVEMRDALEQVQAAANAIQPDAPLRDQGPAVRAFFDRSAAVIRGMVAGA